MTTQISKKGISAGAFLIIAILVISIGYDQILGKISHDDLIEDARDFVSTIETVHPDPYINGGGKIAFHRRYQKFLNSIPDGGMTNKEFLELAKCFLAKIGDGHTNFRIGYSYEKKGIPFHFGSAGRDLYIDDIDKDEYKDLLYAKLLSIENISMEDIIKRLSDLVPHENEFELLVRLSRRLAKKDLLRAVIPEWTSNKEISITLEHIDGSAKTHIVKLGQFSKSDSKVENPSQIELPSRERSDIVYSFLDDKKTTAILIVDDMQTYREAFETWHYAGFDNVRKQAEKCYRRYNNSEPPEDIEELFAGTPSATEIIIELTQNMKAANTKNLIIDLRRNNGGMSGMADILTYFLYGRDDLIKIKGEHTSIVKLSQPYLDRHQNINLEQLNKDKEITLLPSDYEFSGEFDYSDNFDTSSIAKELDKWLIGMTSFYEKYITGEYEAYYLPENVYVLCSPHTYSSGYTFMRYLYKSGAILVGSPSGQSGNCFGEPIPFKLENSEIVFAVSSHYYEDFPNDPEAGKVLMPHHLITFDIMAKYDFDPNTELLYVLDILNVDLD